MAKLARSGCVGVWVAFGVGLLVSNADACGCFAPPIPTALDETSFAVNQQAEQIIFEVGEGTISAHVRIFYSGDPEEFAWLLPMPSVPDLELSSGALFGLIDELSAPVVSSFPQNICPQQKYFCRTHPPCSSGLGQTTIAPSATGGFAANGASDDLLIDAESGPAFVQPPAVQVLAREQIGSYETITFAAEEADLAIDWLNDNGFIVNETMSPYMQPFLDADMVFVASRLVPGADVDEIRPLRLTYEADFPSIPLQLTAIAAEPHMMVTAFIYGREEYDLAYFPLLELDPSQVDTTTRNNYPMLLSRSIDEDGGGIGFVKEYVGEGPVFQDQTGCCAAVVVRQGTSPDPEEFQDVCGIGGDLVCQCPEAAFDREDCAPQEGLVEAVTMARELWETYPVFTRISTRVSPEEMTFNPEYHPSGVPTAVTRLNLTGVVYNLNGCEDAVIEQEDFEAQLALAACSSLYCDYGECVLTEDGVGCACDDDAVARMFTDSDGVPSLTCVPERGTVDFAAGGIELPDACKGREVANGECIDVGGFPAIACDDGYGAVSGPLILGVVSVPTCAVIERASGSPGAINTTTELLDLDVCAPDPPDCPQDGWLEERPVSVEGVECGDGPDSSWFEIPPAPVCGSASEQGNTFMPASASAASDTPVSTAEPRPTRRGGGGLCNLALPAPTSRAPWLGLGFAYAGLLLRRRRKRRQCER